MTERKRDARQAIEDLELDKHLATAGAAAAKLAQEAVSLVGTYADDHDVYSRAREGAVEGRKCFEAQVMDLADDIA